MVALVQEPVDNANEANSEAEEDNESSRPKTNKKLGMDYFNNQETDLKKTGAMSKYLTLPVFYMYLSPNVDLQWWHSSITRYISFD